MGPCKQRTEDYTFNVSFTVSLPGPPNTPPGSSTGGNDPSPTPTPTPTPSTPGATGAIPGHGGTDDAQGDNISIPVTVDSGTGEVRINLDADITEALIADALLKASESADAAGEMSGNAQPVVTLDLSGVADATAAVLSVEAAKLFSEHDVSVTVKLPDADITLAPDALAVLAAANNDSTTLITVEAAVVPKKELKGMQAAQVKGYETVVSIDVFAGGEKIDVPLTVSLPYTLKANENPAAVRIWYMDADGNLTDLKGVFDPGTGMITFTVGHQSYFVVGYDPVALWVNIFSDISDEAWYYDAVAYANYYGLFEGVGGGHFAPAGSMTRAMFVTVLRNQEARNHEISDSKQDTGGAPDGSAVQIFSDVSADAWYFDAVQWAASLGIVSGVGEGRFDPDRSVTRQEIAVMLCNYADYKGSNVPENRAPLPLTDYDEIDVWAQQQSRQLIEAGVFSGDNSSFRPKDAATRAEAAQLFKNFLRFVIGS